MFLNLRPPLVHGKFALFVLAFLSASWLFPITSFADGKRSTLGAVRLIVTKISQSRATSPEQGLRAAEHVFRASGTLFWKTHDNEKKLYLATAYHVVSNALSITIHATTERNNIPAEVLLAQNGRVYVCRICDVAIFELSKELSRQLEPHAFELNGNQFNPAENLGFTASTEGFPYDKPPQTFSQIFYGGTLSQFGETGVLIWENVNEPVVKGEEGLLNTVKNRNVLLMETLSVRKGFSGAPVHVFQNGKHEFVGIVLGGRIQVEPGRFVWLGTREEILNGVSALESDNASIVKWNDQTYWGPELYVESNSFSAPVYDRHGSSFLVESEQPISFEGAVFENCVFDGDGGFVFARKDFTNAIFRDCKFCQPCSNRPIFDEAILNGATFINCTFISIDPKSSIVNERLVGFGIPLLSFGALIENPRFVSYEVRKQDATSNGVAEAFAFSNFSSDPTEGNSSPENVSEFQRRKYRFPSTLIK